MKDLKLGDGKTTLHFCYVTYCFVDNRIKDNRRRGKTSLEISTLVQVRSDCDLDWNNISRSKQKWANSVLEDGLTGLGIRLDVSNEEKEVSRINPGVAG